MGIELFLKKRQFWVGMALLVFGGTYQVINALNWGWWLMNLESNYLAEGALFDGLTLQQVITRDFGFLSFPLYVITLALLVIGVALLWTDTSV
jgi:hypothetical protein